MRHKIILYNPKAVFFDMPLALVAIGSSLDPKQYEVIIIDGRLHADPLPEIQQHLNDALCFGVTALTGSPTHDALKVTRAVRQLHTTIPIVWGGWHTSLFPTETLEDEASIDITVQGQGELTFKEIVACLTHQQPMNDVKGICYRKEGQVVKNPGRLLEDMNDLPAMNYDLIDVEAYFKLKGRRQFDYISSTGCYFRCTFCADPFVFGRNFTAIEPERMGEELEQHYQKYRFDDVNFQDETFFTYRKRVIGIAQQFIDRNINASWAGTMRADQGHRLSEEDFKLCAQSGLRRVLIGVESGSQEMMDWLRKDIKIEYVYECAERCKRHGIAVIFPFIVGFPKETDESIRATVNMVKELSAMDPNFTTPIFYFKPYPGSQITQEVTANGYQLPQTIEEWGEFDYIGSSGPWVSDEKFQFIELFKFYNKVAWAKPRWFALPVQKLAQWRCKKDYYKFPVEKFIIETLKPSPKLS